MKNHLEGCTSYKFPAILGLHLNVHSGGISIGADDGLSNSFEFLSMLGKGLGVASLRGDGFNYSELQRLDEMEALCFEFDEASGLGNALDAAFEFVNVRGNGQVELDFYADGALVESALLDLSGDGVYHDLLGARSFDKVELAVTGDLALELRYAEFARLDPADDLFA